MKKEQYYQEKLEQLEDAKDRSFERQSVPEDVKVVHFSAVCGKFTAALAGMLKHMKYAVTGSDNECFPPVSDLLDELAIQTLPFDAQNLKSADVVVVGNACSPSNPELVHARAQKIPQMSLPEALHHFVMHDKTRLVVAGTHGKTTTTGLLTHVLKTAKKDPGYMIGGVMQGEREGFHYSKKDFFVIEGDEYDSAYFDKQPKFLHYQPHGAIVTSMELDHVDIFKDFEDYEQAFKFFVQDIPEDGTLVLYGDDHYTRRLEEYAKCKVLFYGLSPNDHIFYKRLRRDETKQVFTLVLQDRTEVEITTHMSGRYNILNICAVAGLCYSYGISAEDIAKGIESFSGMKKRQEVIFENKDVTVIDDFAHHPTAVRQTIQGIREKFGDRRIIALFEPRSNSSRRKMFEQAYIESFDDADLLFLKVPPFRHNDEKDDFINIEHMTDEITHRGTLARHARHVEDLVHKLRLEVQKDDVILIMSNGNFDGVYDLVIEMLKDKDR